MTTIGLRAAEFGYLDEGGHVYLDYTGAGLPPRSLVEAHARRVTRDCFGNPHSENPTSRRSSELLAEARAAVLRHFHADPAEYAVVFTPNATGALRLVGESYPFGHGPRDQRRPRRRGSSDRRGRGLVLPIDNHNSVNGLREYARAAGADIAYVPLDDDLRIDERDLFAALDHHGTAGTGDSGAGGLFAYPAQSNFTGVRHPLTWIEAAHARGWHTLLDAAAYVPTHPLDLSEVRPDFTVVSWYKVFGYPTGVGSLIARREALARLRRPWFAGGTVHVASAKAEWHVMARGETAFEDGTVNFLSIPDVTSGLAWIDAIGMDAVHAHVTALTGRLLDGLARLRHTDGTPLIRLYGPRTPTGRGGTVALSVLDREGRVVDERLVARDSSRSGISLRTGCFCNPGAGEAAFGLSPSRLRAVFGRGSRQPAPRSVEDYVDWLGLPSGGAVRVSVGIASVAADVDAFLHLLTSAYRDRAPGRAGLAPRDGC